MLFVLLQVQSLQCIPAGALAARHGRLLPSVVGEHSPSECVVLSHHHCPAVIPLAAPTWLMAFRFLALVGASPRILMHATMSATSAAAMAAASGAIWNRAGVHSFTFLSVVWSFWS